MSFTPISKVKDDNESLHLRIEAMFTPNTKNIFLFYTGFGYNNLDIPQLGFGGTNQGFRRRKLNSQYQLRRWKKSLLSGNDVQVQLYHNKMKLTEPQL